MEILIVLFLIASIWSLVKLMFGDPWSRATRAWKASAAARAEARRQQVANAHRDSEHRREMERLREAGHRDRLLNEQRRLAQDESQLRADLQKRQAAGEQRRRNDARAQCETYFSIFEPELRQRYARSHFELYVRTYMSDALPADEVEARAVQLLEILEQHRAVNQAAEPFDSLEDLAAWYVEQKEKILKLPVEFEYRAEHLARLNSVYAELSERVLEQMS